MKQILIIDDEKDILKSVNAILTEEGYKCYEATNSKDALNIYGKKIVIGMGAGTISTWMRELPKLL